MKGEKEKYEEIWTREEYRVRSPGQLIAPTAYDMLPMLEGDSLMDWGCGDGKAVRWFAEKGVVSYGIDISKTALRGEFPGEKMWVADFNELPKDVPMTDWAFCADVMEHLPKKEVENVLQVMQRMTWRGAFIQVAHFPDDREGVGPLHLTVETPSWWADTIRKFFTLVRILPDSDQGRTAFVVNV